jgi:hypothetical protein
MTNLVDHARRELICAQETPDTISDYLDILQSLSNLAHSGHSTGRALDILEKLAALKTLTPLTNDPTEWNIISHSSEEETPEGLWQSVRNAEAFSRDGGNTYYILSERDFNPTLVHTSINVESDESNDD